MRWNRFLPALALAFTLPLAAASSDAPDAFADAAAVVRDNASGHRLILLGEKHATAEIPLLVATLVDDLSTAGPVVLALEFPRSEQAALDQYLASDGSAVARTTLKSAPYWQVQGDQHDGRRNDDVFDMFERLRALRVAQRDVRLLPFDVTPGIVRNHHQRDQAMAEYLREQYTANPTAQFLVLAGNVHAMIRKPTHAPPEMQQPMGSYLADLDPYSVNISALEGQFWGCAGGRCAAKDERPAQWESGPAPDGGAYHFQLVLPRFSVARLLGRAEPAASSAAKPD
jgi:erythromycin esterase-like protein